MTPKGHAIPSKTQLLSYAPRPLGAGVKEGENTILHDALYCKTQTAK